MTVYDAFVAQAYEDFDALVVEAEQQQRARLRAAGWSKRQIDLAIDRCRPGLAEQRAGLPALVAVSMMRSGVQIEKGINA